MIGRGLWKIAQTQEEMQSLFSDISHMLGDMGYDAPAKGDPEYTWVPKIHAFVRDHYTEWKLGQDWDGTVEKMQCRVPNVDEEDGA